MIIVFALADLLKTGGAVKGDRRIVRPHLQQVFAGPGGPRPVLPIRHQGAAQPLSLCRWINRQQQQFALRPRQPRGVKTRNFASSANHRQPGARHRGQPG